jgi:hypothetical protein
MNMGTASDIKNISKILKSVKHSLKPNGKFLFSFYNSESLLAKIGFLPWPMPLAAYIDYDKHCLEVNYDNQVYFLYARPRSVDEVRRLLSEFNFEVENIYTFPTYSSILPNIILEDEDSDEKNEQKKEAKKLIEKIDIKLTSTDLNSGTYIIVTGSKSK